MFLGGSGLWSVFSEILDSCFLKTTETDCLLCWIWCLGTCLTCAWLSLGLNRGTFPADLIYRPHLTSCFALRRSWEICA